MLVKIFRFYIDGFKNMKLGRTLWAVILVKLFIMFAVIKVLFFDENLSTKFQTDEQKSEFVIENLTKER